MDIAGILIGFVQVAIALVAFTTISVVVVQVSESTTESLLAVRLKYILLFSMHLIVLGILPLVFYQLSGETVLRTVRRPQRRDPYDGDAWWGSGA